jgi:DNA gyrase subunit A
MATNIPPHNLGEIVDATIHHRREPRRAMVDDGELMEREGARLPDGRHHLRAPRHPQAYRTGRGNIVMRARAEVEPLPGKGDREQIVVTEIPYQVNKADLVEKIAELVREKRIEGISELRDESTARACASSSSSSATCPPRSC